MSLAFGASRNVSFNYNNHIFKLFTKGFENLPSSFFFNSENLLSSIGQCTCLHLYFLFGKFHLHILNKMADNTVTAFPHETDFDISKDRFCWIDIFVRWFKTINCHINLLDHYLRERSVLPVSATICRPDFPCFIWHTPWHFYSMAWVFLSLSLSVRERWWTNNEGNWQWGSTLGGAM